MGGSSQAASPIVSGLPFCIAILSMSLNLNSNYTGFMVQHHFYGCVLKKDLN